jgi:hypothetical protein
MARAVVIGPHRPWRDRYRFAATCSGGTLYVRGGLAAIIGKRAQLKRSLAEDHWLVHDVADLHLATALTRTLWGRP